MRDIKETIARIGGHRNRECYVVLAHAVEAACRYQPQGPPQMKMILQDIEAMMGGAKSAAAISRSLSRANTDIWEFGDHNELQKVCGYSIQDPPTPKELIQYLAEYVREGEEARWREQKIRYRRWRSLTGTGYGIIVNLRQPAYRAATCPFCRDLETVERLVRRLNAEQTPLPVFEERYLGGTLLEWLERT